MAQLAIRGHATRGEEVIKILEKLGGSNMHNYSADCDSLCFYIGKGVNIIYWDWVHNCYEDEDTLVFTLEEFLDKFPYKIGDKVSSKYLKNYEIEKMEWNDTNNRVIYKLRGMGWYSADELQPYKEETMEETIKIDIPKGYEFAGVDDDNQQVVFTKIGYHYPNTYEECCEILGLEGSIIEGCLGYEYKLLNAFQKLLMCRDAYWKIAGDWKHDVMYCDLYCIGYDGNVITWKMQGGCRLLVFPTSEMRDAFYENFKELIEECKELI